MLLRLGMNRGMAGGERTTYIYACDSIFFTAANFPFKSQCQNADNY